MRTPDAEKEKDKKLIDPDEYDIMQVGDTAYEGNERSIHKFKR